MRTKSQKLRHLRIHPSQRMRQSQRRNLAQPRALANPHKTRAPVALLVQRHHQRPLKRRCVIRAGRVAQMMIQRRNTSVRRPCHLPHDAHIIQLAPQLPRSLVHEISAGNRRKWRQPRPKRSLPLPRPPRTARNRHMPHVTPTDPSALQAITNRLARNSFYRPRTRQFALFHRRHNPGITQQRRRRIVPHRGNSQNVHARSLHANDWQNDQDRKEQREEGVVTKISRRLPTPPQIPTHATGANRATIGYASTVRAAPAKSTAAGSNKRATIFSKPRRANIRSTIASPDRSANPPACCNHPAENHAANAAATNADPARVAIYAAHRSTRHSKSPPPRPKPRGIR